MNYIYLSNPIYLNSKNLDLLNKHILASDWHFFNKSLIKNTTKLNIDDSIKMSKQISIDEKQYLENLYKSFIKNFQFLLHENCEYLIGPWLRHIIFYSFQSWLLIQRVKKNYNSIFIENQFLDYKPPRDFNSFMTEVCEGNINEYCCYKAAQFHQLRIFFHENLKNINNEKTSRKKYNIYRIFTNILSLNKISSFIDGNKNTQKILNLLFSFKKNKFLIYRCRKSFFLFLYGNLFTKYGWKYLLLKNNFKFKNSNKSIRKNILDLENNFKTNYEKYLCHILSKTIPEFYLSNSKKNSNIYMKNKHIITSTGHWNEDRFKKFLSENISLLDKLSVYQHGGTFGMTKFEFNQYVYETSIPNNYLSWGWSHKNNNKIVPFIYNFPIIKIPRIPIRNKRFEICVILTRVKAFSRGDPWDNSEWNKLYINNLLGICQSLNKLQINFCLRPHPSQDKLISLENFLEDKVKNIKFNYGQMHYNKYDLYLITQNSTNLIDFLYLNTPTIIFIEDKLEASDKFSYHIERLKKHKIFHSSLDTMLNHLEFLNQSKSNLNNWWNDTNSQNTIKDFLNEFASTDLSNLQFLKKI